jgi:hypothetical protein
MAGAREHRAGGRFTLSSEQVDMQYVYTGKQLRQIAAMVDGIEKAEAGDEVGGLYFRSPVEIRDNEISYGQMVCQDGLWGFVPWTGGPRTADDG